jgi:beta-galactosidase
MRNTSLILLALLAVIPAAAQSRTTQDFDTNWRYTFTEVSHAEQPTFDDHAWTPVTLPHDAAIAGPMNKSNPTGQGGAYMPSGITWYRKTFTLPPNHQRAYIVFDGVMANSDVYLNGTLLGHRPNGTVSFFYDITPQLHSGPNTIAVRCDTSQQPASRWYEGIGIYRPVRLVRTNDVHIAPWSTFVTTPAITADSAKVQVQADITNDSASAVNPRLQITLVGPNGKAVTSAVTPAKNVPTKSTIHTTTELTVANPKLWDLDTPNLYHAVVRVLSDNQTLDEDQQQFGIREFHFDPNTGFWLNGHNFKIKGAALHIDGSAFGIAVPESVYDHRLLALKAVGVNAIRTAHNPPSPQFLDACDRLGLLVMDEMFDQWTVAKNPYDYHLYFQKWAMIDTRDTVRRDRNHPSIILYSAGNEIHDTPQAELAHKILAALVLDFHDNDPTRPVTQGLFRPNASHDYNNGLADLLDVVGQNYREKEILAAHDQKPARKIIGTENGHDRPVWLALRDNAPYSGQFLWTGIDYLGEAGEAGGWPVYANGAGLLDRTAFPRARAYERQSWWSSAPNVHIARRIAASESTSTDPGYAAQIGRFRQTLFLDWTPSSLAPHDETVEVYTNCDEVDLLLNDTSLGRQKLHSDASPLTWKVPFQSGSLKAIAYKNGQRVAHDELRTATKATKLVLTPERTTLTPSPDDVVFLTATVVDATGTVVPDAANLIQFSVTGPAAIATVDSGSNVDQSPFQASERKAYEGRNVVTVRATAAAGAITVTASADGLTSATASLTTKVMEPPAFIRSF